jgi:putative DNA primase/helicase
MPGTWADVDVKPELPTAVHDEKELARVLRALPRPTVIVNSGSGGLHLYWLLREPTDDVERAATLQRLWIGHLSRAAGEALGREVRLDAVKDLSRVLRLPGTVRWPKKEGERPTLVELVHADGARYALEELEAQVPEELRREPERVRVGEVRIDVSDRRLAAYVRAAVEREASDLAGMGPQSGRNNRLNKAAYSLAGLGAHGALDRDVVYDALHRACDVNGLNAEDGEMQFDATFNSGWDAGLEAPRTLPAFLAEEHPTMPPPSAPMAVARALVDREYRAADDLLTLRSWRGDFYHWSEGRWWESEDNAVRSWVYLSLEDAAYEVCDEEGDCRRVPWAPNRRKVGDVLEALRSVVHLAESVNPPALLTAPDATGRGVAGPRFRPDAVVQGAELVATGNGLLHVPVRRLYSHTPRLFNLIQVPFSYDSGAPEPETWNAFLQDLWPDDPASRNLLEEFIGYVISGDTRQHKMLAMIGPPRSGRGTIARVLRALLGGNVAGPTLASLGTNFGLWPLVGKPLAIISDARLGGTSTQVVVERLLSISGEDALTVDRKFKEPWTEKFPTRIVLISNELPNFGDASGAIATRFLVLTLQRSWLGKEDHDLTEKLMGELPGIFNRALAGLDRLRERGRFEAPASSEDAVALMHDVASPIHAFVRERCVLGSEQRAWVNDVRDAQGRLLAPGLYNAYVRWCKENGHKARSAQWFGRDLNAAYPALRRVRHTEGERPYYYVGIGLTAEEAARSQTLGGRLLGTPWP